MFSDSQLNVLSGLLARHQDPAVSSSDYDSLMSVVQSLQAMRSRDSIEDARRHATDGPSDIPQPFNDPVDW